MTLAITTTIGQAHEHRGRRLIRDFGTFTHSTAHYSPPDVPATLDAVYSRDGVLVAVVEARHASTTTCPRLRAMARTW